MRAVCNMNMGSVRLLLQLKAISTKKKKTKKGCMSYLILSRVKSS